MKRIKVIIQEIYTSPFENVTGLVESDEPWRVQFLVPEVLNDRKLDVCINTFPDILQGMLKKDLVLYADSNVGQVDITEIEFLHWRLSLREETESNHNDE